MDKKEMEQFLCVKIGGRWLGVDASKIVEIVNPASDEHAGMEIKKDSNTISYHGKILQTIQLADILIGTHTHYDTAQRILISEVGERMAGLIVDSAEEIVRIPKENIVAIDPTQSDLNIESLEGTIEMEEKKISILSLDKLYQMTGVV